MTLETKSQRNNLSPSQNGASILLCSSGLSRSLSLSFCTSGSKWKGMIIITSADNQQYITVELFNARMERLEAIIERNIAVSRADIAELKAFVEKIMLNLKLKSQEFVRSLNLKSQVSVRSLKLRLQMFAPKSVFNLLESITSFTGIIGSSLSSPLSSSCLPLSKVFALPSKLSPTV